MIHEGKVDGARAVSEPEVFNAEPRMDTNKHECKRITPSESWKLELVIPRTCVRKC